MGATFLAEIILTSVNPSTLMLGGLVQSGATVALGVECSTSPSLLITICSLSSMASNSRFEALVHEDRIVIGRTYEHSIKTLIVLSPSLRTLSIHHLVLGSAARLLGGCRRETC